MCFDTADYGRALHPLEMARVPDGSWTHAMNVVPCSLKSDVCRFSMEIGTLLLPTMLERQLILLPYRMPIQVAAVHWLYTVVTS